MAGNLEIERKFLLAGTDWGTPVSSQPIAQGYLMTMPDRNLRVRRTGTRYTMTLKVRAEGIGRHEIETEIDPEQGRLALERLCILPPILKTRHVVRFGRHDWEIDVFAGANEGLVLAEVELGAEDEAFERPPWLGPEVTLDGRFTNEYLARNPFRDWGVSYRDLP